jgi:hypothetical protein
MEEMGGEGRRRSAGRRQDQPQCYTANKTCDALFRVLRETGAGGMPGKAKNTRNILRFLITWDV